MRKAIKKCAVLLGTHCRRLIALGLAGSLAVQTAYGAIGNGHEARGNDSFLVAYCPMPHAASNFGSQALAVHDISISNRQAPFGFSSLFEEQSPAAGASSPAPAVSPPGKAGSDAGPAARIQPLMARVISGHDPQKSLEDLGFRVYRYSNKDAQRPQPLSDEAIAEFAETLELASIPSQLEMVAALDRTRAELAKNIIDYGNEGLVIIGRIGNELCVFAYDDGKGIKNLDGVMTRTIKSEGGRFSGGGYALWDHRDGALSMNGTFSIESHKRGLRFSSQTPIPYQSSVDQGLFVSIAVPLLNLSEDPATASDAYGAASSRAPQMHVTSGELPNEEALEILSNRPEFHWDGNYPHEIIKSVFQPALDPDLQVVVIKTDLGKWKLYYAWGLNVQTRAVISRLPLAQYLPGEIARASEAEMAQTFDVPQAGWRRAIRLLVKSGTVGTYRTATLTEEAEGKLKKMVSTDPELQIESLGMKRFSVGLKKPFVAAPAELEEGGIGSHSSGEIVDIAANVGQDLLYDGVVPHVLRMAERQNVRLSGEFTPKLFVSDGRERMSPSMQGSRVSPKKRFDAEMERIIEEILGVATFEQQGLNPKYIYESVRQSALLANVYNGQLKMFLSDIARAGSPARRWIVARLLPSSHWSEYSAGLTAFLRDEEQFPALRRQFRRLYRERLKTKELIRMVSVPCSIGYEPISMAAEALLESEAHPSWRRGSRWRVPWQVIGIDLHYGRLLKAQTLFKAGTKWSEHFELPDSWKKMAHLKRQLKSLIRFEELSILDAAALDIISNTDILLLNNLFQYMSKFAFQPLGQAIAEMKFGSVIITSEDDFIDHLDLHPKMFAREILSESSSVWIRKAA